MQLDSACFANGVSFFHSPASSGSELAALRTWPERLHMSYCYYLISKNDSSKFGSQKSNGPSFYGWDTLLWQGSFDSYIGNPTTDYYTTPDTGTDNDANTYYIETRPYDSGLVVLRMRIDGGSSQDDSVSYALGGTYYQLMPEGDTSATPVTSTLMRNGEGKIFLTLASSSQTENSINKNKIIFKNNIIQR